MNMYLINMWKYGFSMNQSRYRFNKTRNNEILHVIAFICPCVWRELHLEMWRE